MSQDFDVFVDGQYQAAAMHRLDRSGEDFRPGNLATASFGLRYEADPNIVPQLQVNLSRKAHDQGALADVQESAGTVTYLSPGLSVKLMPAMQICGFVQLPVYSKLDGYRLLPKSTATADLSYVL